MWDRVKRFLAAPVFADEEKSRIAALLNIILLAVILVSLVRVGGSFISRTQNLGAALLVNGVMIFTMVGLRFLMRNGRVKLASYLAVGIVWGIVAIGSSRLGGIRGPLFGSLGAVILATGLLLGGWAAVGFAGAEGAGLGLDAAGGVEGVGERIERGAAAVLVGDRFDAARVVVDV